jgi:hypothetical protein
VDSDEEPNGIWRRWPEVTRPTGIRVFERLFRAMAVRLVHEHLSGLTTHVDAAAT